MNRRLSKLLTITGELETTEPLHVGGAESAIETDLPLARDGRGRLYVPGTSLAGPMRAWMEEAFNGSLADVNALWGDADLIGASRILVDDALVTESDSGNAEIWDHVGIDREYGSAAKGVKYDREVLPPGTTLQLSLEAELDGPAEPTARTLIGHLLQALANGVIGFGAARTRGNGGIKLKRHTVQIVEDDWSKLHSVIALLRKRIGQLEPDGISMNTLVKARTDLKPTPEDFIDIEIVWEPAGPVMVKSPRDGEAIDMLPFVSGTSTGFAMVLPGASIKGALRSQAERIVRTVRRSATAWSDEPRARHRQQLAEPLVTTLFGTARRASESDLEEDDASDLGPLPGKSAVSVAQCSSRGTVPSLRPWLALETATKETLSDAVVSLAVEGFGRLDPAMHVAIDRWTGGAADTALFSAVEPFGVSWTPIKLRLDLRRILPAERDAAIGLLLVLLRDLTEGRITIGFGGNRGYGAIAVTSVVATVSNGSLAATYSWLGGTNLLSLAALEAAKLQGIEANWQRWIDTAEPLQTSVSV